MKAIAISLSVLLTGIAAYLTLWPVPLNPEMFEAPTAPALKGRAEPNKLLSLSESIEMIDGQNLESVAFDENGILYASVSDGRIVRRRENDGQFETFAHTGGHPLGLAVDKAQNLIVADASRGLLSVSKDGTVDHLVSKVSGKPVLFADDLDIASDGIVYFSDASIYPITDNARKEVMDCRPHGRLIAYNPQTGQSKEMMADLYFANGVAVSPDGSFVLVAETFAYRITRLWLNGPEKGKRDIFIENLPGFPDNISCNGNDKFWVALVSPRNKDLEVLQAKPFLRKIMMRLPSSWLPSPTPQKHGFVLGINMEGKVLHNLQDPEGVTISQITSALEYDGALYLGSLSGSGVTKVPLMF